MSTTPACQHCGAPWRPDVTGACWFCRVVAPPAGTPGSAAGARPTIDGDALNRLLRSLTTDQSHLLDRLAAVLQTIAGERVTVTGTPVSRLQLTVDDWQYQAQIDRGDVETRAVHAVRGVVLKHQPLPFDEWVACVAGHLAEYAATHRHVYDAIVALDRARPA